tara:strand:- start:191 stop:658 length:468 start_codon:yes stop_codon:yes gene_type:complete
MKFNLNLDFLKNTGDALANIEADEKKLEEFKMEKRKSDIERSDESKAIETTEDIDVVPIETTLEKEKEEVKESEDDLEKKLKNIEKVIETFSGDGGASVIKNTGKLPASIDLNQQPLDMGNTQAKQYQAEYLKPSNVQDERIALLYNDLKKYNLI